MRDFGCEVTSDEAAEMFYAFDKDNSGHVSFDELLTALRLVFIQVGQTVHSILDRRCVNAVAIW